MRAGVSTCSSQRAAKESISVSHLSTVGGEIGRESCLSSARGRRVISTGAFAPNCPLNRAGMRSRRRGLQWSGFYIGCTPATVGRRRRRNGDRWSAVGGNGRHCKGPVVLGARDARGLNRCDRLAAQPIARRRAGQDPALRPGGGPPTSTDSVGWPERAPSSAHAEKSPGAETSLLRRDATRPLFAPVNVAFSGREDESPARRLLVLALGSPPPRAPTPGRADD